MQTYLGYIEKMLGKKVSLLEKKMISDRDSKILEVPHVSSVIDTGFPASESITTVCTTWPSLTIRNCAWEDRAEN